MRRMIMDTVGRYDAALVRYTTGPAHRHPIGLAQPVGLHALLRGHRVIPIEHAVSVQQGRR